MLSRLFVECRVNITYESFQNINPCVQIIQLPNDSCQQMICCLKYPVHVLVDLLSLPIAVVAGNVVLFTSTRRWPMATAFGLPFMATFACLTDPAPIGPVHRSGRSRDRNFNVRYVMTGTKKD